MELGARAPGRPPAPRPDRTTVGPDPEPAGEIFEALADPTRRHLVAELSERAGATATELAAGLPVTRQAVAKHLSALRAAGLVEAERNGREVRYRLTPEPLGGALAWLVTVGAQWDERLERLRRHLGGNRPGSPPGRSSPR
ncbi:MAG: winged helix-turn-helix transcriptional regulator [Actinobacteria bacterium]|nr:winged helix-turn-helix transcriptional regulator [Actinomycetota bacterium]